MSACFAYSKERLRCDQDAGHEGTHTFTTYWSDDECFDPSMDSTTIWREKPTGGSALIGVTNTEQPLPIYAVGLPQDDDGGTPGRCFTCNCSEAAHVPGEGCAAHSCKAFLA